jgi:phasin family protein
MDTNSLVDMLKKFGSDHGLPQVDVDKLVDVYRKNLDDLAKSANDASESAKSVAIKQMEIAESAFRETLEQVRDFKPTGNPQEILSKQTELARQAFDATIDNTRDLAELVKKSGDDALAIVGDRIKESVAALRAGFEGGGSAKDKP